MDKSPSNVPSPEDSPEEIIEADIFDNPSSFPPAVARAHARLAKRAELVKLHQKHYHMNMEQFKLRNKALHLPKSDTWQKNKNAPSRSRTSGLRSEVLGEMTS